MVTVVSNESDYVTEELAILTVFITIEREKVTRICLNPLFDG